MINESYNSHNYKSNISDSILLGGHPEKVTISTLQFAPKWYYDQENTKCHHILLLLYIANYIEI